MARTRIKICGIRDDDALLAAAEAGVDAVGFVFDAASPVMWTPTRRSP
jgi:phosphoribosylanthranilate isomerase